MAKKRKRSAESEEKIEKTSKKDPKVVEEETVPPKVDPPPTHYAVIGEDNFEPERKIRHVSEWIAKSTDVSTNLTRDKVPLDELSDLDDDLMSIVRSENITHWFPVQTKVIPVLLEEYLHPKPLPARDICIAAPTGSGKTLCYVLPLIQALKNRLVPRVRALIMLPVQDLANQVYRVFEVYAKNSNLNLVLLTGQRDFGAERKVLFPETADRGRCCTADVIVATVGRLLDHLLCDDGLQLDLRFLRYLVIDEADRMITDYRSDWLSSVETAVYGNAVASDNFRREKPAISSIKNLLSVKIPLQKILLSATLTQDPELLQQLNLFKPRLFSVKRGNTVTEEDTVVGMSLPNELKQCYVLCEEKLKPLMVYQLLENNPNWKKLLCFVNSKEAGRKLSQLLTFLVDSQFSVQLCTSDSFQKQRRKAFKKFNEGNIRLLICSDLMARGMDLESVDCVINYSTLTHVRNYIHRAGRTARAGQKGTVVTLLLNEQVPIVLH